VPIPPLQSGQLPEGRWVCTPKEVEAMHVEPGAPREAIWRDWIVLTATVRRIVGRVPSAWMSGSFFTDKPAPGDIDCIYLIDTDDVQRAMLRRDADSALLWTISRSGSKSRLNLNVDSYVLEWAPTPGPDPMPRSLS
jgi:hypothetical protein